MRKLIVHKKVVIFIAGFLAVVGIGYAYHLDLLNYMVPALQNRSNCIQEREKIDVTERKVGQYERLLEVRINNKENVERREFTILNVTGANKPFEIRKCGIYVVRQFNIDTRTLELSDNFNISLWQFDFASKGGRKILDQAYNDNSGKEVVAFSFDFRVSPNEQFVVVTEGNTFREKYNLVIKSLVNFTPNNLEDAMVIPFKDMIRTNPNIHGSIGFLEWSDDSRYFWGNIFDGAEVTAFFRVDMQNKSFEVYETPKVTLGGDALTLNPNTGYFTYDPNGFWSPDVDDTKQWSARNRANGVHSELRVRHLPSGEDFLIDSTSEPLFEFRPRWLDDGTLEYQLPSGTTTAPIRR